MAIVFLLTTLKQVARLQMRWSRFEFDGVQTPPDGLQPAPHDHGRAVRPDDAKRSTLYNGRLTITLRAVQSDLLLFLVLHQEHVDQLNDYYPLGCMMPRKRNPVYSTADPDFTHHRPVEKPKKPVSLPPEEQTAEIRREKKGRGGKTVTVIYNLQLTADDLKTLSKQLKKSCGAGGAVKDGSIEVQGDHRDKVAEELQKLGYKTKFIGG